MRDDVFERRTRRFVEVMDILDALATTPWERYRDVPARRASMGGIDAEEAALWRRMIGFRNVVVHDDVDVDRRVVFEVLRSHLGELRALRRRRLERHVRG